jgi:hypothetical protein
MYILIPMEILNMHQLSPCICSKAKLALGIENYYQGNKKTCTDSYWRKVVIHLGNKYGVSQKRIDRALTRKDLYSA